MTARIFSSSRRRTRGFMFFLAVLMIAFVATAMLAISGVIHVDAKRTLNRSMQAQLDQLLIAGAEDATLRLNSGNAMAPAQTWNIELPAELAAATATLTSTLISFDPAQSAVMTVHARFADQASEQTLRFRPDGGRWRIESAELIQ